MNSTGFEYDVAMDTLELMDKFDMSESDAYEAAYTVNAERYGAAVESYDEDYEDYTTYEYATNDAMEAALTSTAADLVNMYDDMSMEEALDIAESYVYGE